MTRSPTKPRDEKAELRGYIVDLAKSIAESSELHPHDGQEPAMEKLTEAARVLCQIYGLLDRTGDLDDAGSALKDYRKEFGKRGTR